MFNAKRSLKYATLLPIMEFALLLMSEKHEHAQYIITVEKKLVKNVNL